VKIKLPVIAPPFCKREPDCVWETLVFPAFVRLISQLPESTPDETGVLLLLLLPPQPLMNNDSANKNAIPRCIRSTSSGRFMSFPHPKS
jgi:hypothetical protein